MECASICYASFIFLIGKLLYRVLPLELYSICKPASVYGELFSTAKENHQCRSTRTNSTLAECTRANSCLPAIR